MIAKAVAAAVAALALGGCALPTVSPAATVTVQAPKPVATYPEDNNRGEMIDLAMETVWDRLTSEEQASACVGWYIDQDSMIESFLDGAGTTTPFSRSELVAGLRRLMAKEC